ncbi:uncharacterized protein LOC100680238 isoform X2 [Nasonia vitripennis]|uniref:BZIP domain-containing protein n=1 Tax=Nasonia vitripennis TaxID=7425 RepID=A0A7M7INT3_NASVI|nr:uncharacterized protein LOC100680238 isoform X2 [Nasonia vitripennis]XP_032451957.1 uncharacterized protein LOC100680238 isoform X2 [Nasonia vitripennis]
MASKRQHMIDYAEDSYTDDEDEMDLDDHQEQMQENRPRVGRPRKTSVTTNSSMETLTNHGKADNISINDGGASTVRRRGRGPSKRPCLNRNALMARENRQRKKEYIERIESRLQICQKENMELNTTIKQQAIEIKRLNSEVSYLKTVLSNKSRITSLLQAMNESLQRMHGDETNNAASNFPGAAANSSAPVVKPNGSGLACKPSVDVLNWITRVNK